MRYFSMTAVYYWKSSPPKQRRFERRTTLCSAKNIKKAEAKLLKEAKSYATNEIVFLNEYDMAELDEPPSKKPIEVAYNLTLAIHPKSGKKIKPKQFLQEYWNCERIKNCKNFGFKHAWHNKDNVNSACYNCDVIRKGQLWKNT